MDTIATALSYCFDEQEYSRLSNLSSEDSLGGHEGHHQYYASHDQVVDVLLHREESNVSETDLYMVHEESNMSEADCYMMDPNNQYYLTESSQEIIPQPLLTTTLHQETMVQCDDRWRTEAKRNKEKPTHNILLQRTHTKRSKVGAATKRFEDETKREQYKKAACERERARMKDCNKIFAQLRAGLPMTKASGKRVSKIETLRMAIRYIKHLRTVLSYPPGSHIPQHVLNFNPASDDSDYIQY